MAYIIMPDGLEASEFAAASKPQCRNSCRDENQPLLGTWTGTVQPETGLPNRSIWSKDLDVKIQRVVVACSGSDGKIWKVHSVGAAIDISRHENWATPTLLPQDKAAQLLSEISSALGIPWRIFFINAEVLEPFALNSAGEILQ